MEGLLGEFKTKVKLPYHISIPFSSLLMSHTYIYIYISGFGGLGVTCWPLVPKFAGSNLAEAVKKSSARLPSEGK